VIRPCDEHDFDAICGIVNEAAAAYKGVIPADCWREPYMPRGELQEAIDGGVEFWGFEEDGVLVGVMGVQPVQDVTLVRHAYVRTSRRRRGIGGQLLRFLKARIRTPALVGTWAAADWAYAENPGAFLAPGGFTIRHDLREPLLANWPNPEVIRVGDQYHSFADPCE
jgi:GNAT superfamily N-acetyltransferase